MYTRYTGAPTRVLALVLVCVLATLLVASRAEAKTYRVGDFSDGLHAELFDPGSMPPGSNDWSCKPSTAHPQPVVLVHATLSNSALTWQMLSPMLANEGYCVFAFNYGKNFATLGRFYGMTAIGSSAGELKTFVDRVLAATGASKVDIVGHSQGGMMPRYYLKNLGGGAQVRTMIGLAASNHGTTVFGFDKLVSAFKFLGIPLTSLVGCASCTDQLADSKFLAELNRGGDTVPGPRYLSIATRFDEVITPYTSTFLNGTHTKNIVLQDHCSNDFVDHVGIMYDPNAMQFVVNALGPNRPDFQPACTRVLPIVGG